MPDICQRISAVKEKIRASAEKSGRSPDDVLLISVSKTVGLDRIREAVKCGVMVFGESRVQEAKEKIGALAGKGLKWHLIGHLQTNKVKYIFDLFDCIHSVNTLELAREIDKRAAMKNRTMDILLQVNIGNDPAKFGADPERTLVLVREISNLKNVSLNGLMAIPPFNLDPEESRPYYIAMRELKDWIRQKGFELKELSMGMSNDFEVAVEEGATLVRVGSAIFGEREYV